MLHIYIYIDIYTAHTLAHKRLNRERRCVFVYSYGRISLAHKYQYDPGLANFCKQYRRSWLLTIVLFSISVPNHAQVDRLCVAFGGTCGITDWRISGAYHKLDWNILWAKKGQGKGRGGEREGSEINNFGNYIVFCEILKGKMNWRISLAHNPAHM